jgi:hypothetical protein
MNVINSVPTLLITMLGVMSVGASDTKDRPSNAVDGIWTHKSSSIALPEMIGGLPRQLALPLAASDPQAAISFGSTNGGETLSVDIFRNMSGDVPLWFSQAQRSVESRRDYDGAKLAVPPTPFGLPAIGDDTGLLAVYDRRPAGKRQSIGVALFSVGGWYVHLRAVSSKRAAADTAAWMQAAIADLKFSPTSPGKAIRPITACANPLAHPAGSPEDVPAYGLVTLTKREKAPESRITGSFWCLDSNLGDGRVVYRPTGTNDRYLLATDHLGAALSVRGEAPTGGTPSYYSIVSIEPRTIEVLAMLDRLPPPAYTLERKAKDRSLRSYGTWPSAR